MTGHATHYLGHATGREEMQQEMQGFQRPVALPALHCARSSGGEGGWKGEMLEIDTRVYKEP